MGILHPRHQQDYFNPKLTVSRPSPHPPARLPWKASSRALGACGAPGGGRVVRVIHLTVGLRFIPLMISDAEPLFVCLLAVHMFLEKYPVWILCPLLTILIYLFGCPGSSQLMCGLSLAAAHGGSSVVCRLPH